MTLVACAHAQAQTIPPYEVRDLVLDTADMDFGGLYVDIEGAMAKLGVTRLQAHEIQRVMRDELETLSGSPSAIQQAPHLKQALADAVDSVVNRGISPSGFKPLTFKKGEFVVVFDLDETLLTHWYRLSKGTAQERRGSFPLALRDTVPSYVDRGTGDTVAQPKLMISGSMVQLRPGIDEFTQAVSVLPGCKGFVLFTAKEDRTADAMIAEWKKRDPYFFSHVLGVLGRNHLRMGNGLAKPSKDMRIFDESLQHVILLDDNESRVMQKELCFQIPKFNADSYLVAKGTGRTPVNASIVKAHELMLPYAAGAIEHCADEAALGPANALAQCWSDGLGNGDGTAGAELTGFGVYLHRQGIDLPAADLTKTFDQPFEFEFSRPLSGPFPTFKAGKLQGSLLPVQ
ncbi:MAG TPA: NIF family HAD-type phosphatase [Bdellovibrionota bacterium]|nr:NIF family HAD-type phosphatase [Bdellovibrionota bacterium]